MHNNWPHKQAKRSIVMKERNKKKPNKLPFFSNLYYFLVLTAKWIFTGRKDLRYYAMERLANMFNPHFRFTEFGQVWREDKNFEDYYTKFDGGNYHSLDRKYTLNQFLQLVKNVSDEIQLIPKMKGFWDHLLIPFRTRHMGKYALFSLQKVINWHIKDPLLQAVLNVQCGDHGLPPSKASFPVHCVVMNHYFNGGFYPMGGGAAIVKAMTKAIHKYHGEIRTSQRVKKILLEGDKKKKAVGVMLESGEIIKAKNILCNADPAKTFELTGKENLSKKLQHKLAKTRYSVTSLFLFLGVH